MYLFETKRRTQIQGVLVEVLRRMFGPKEEVRKELRKMHKEEVQNVHSPPNRLLRI
jgi:vacuolar-type H+-ATPase subunit E/Vma4